MSLFKNKDNKDVIFEKTGHVSTGMKLFYLGNRISTCKEQNIESDNKFGFIVTIKYTKEYANFTEYTLRKIYNYTQVHYGYTDMGTIKPFTKIAFESAINSCGYNAHIENIDVIEIELADKKYVRYYEECIK